MNTNPDLPSPKTVADVARAFAILVAEEIGDANTRRVDERNRQGRLDVCHSHDFCDANVCMQQAIHDVTGVPQEPLALNCCESADTLWGLAWCYAKYIGFSRLSVVRGVPGCPPQDIEVDATKRVLTVSLPDLPKPENYPLDIELDYHGRTPHLQVLCRDHDSAEGEPSVCVRYDSYGKVSEVLVGNNQILVVNSQLRATLKMYSGTGDTPWEIEREANPTCQAGDRLKMPSGQVADVMRLRERYDNDIEQFRAYDETYGILNRLDGYPGSDPRHQVYCSIEQAWDVNPLTAGTTDPADFSTVSERTQPTPDDHD